MPSETEKFTLAQSQFKKEVNKLVSPEEHHSFGDKLFEAIKVKEVRRYLDLKMSDGEMIQVFEDHNYIISSLDLQELKRKAGATVAEKSKVEDLVWDREFSMDEFVKTSKSDIDIFSWSSYYTVLKYAKELVITRHAKDEAGIFLETGKVPSLIRSAFKRIFPIEVIEYATLHKKIIATIKPHSTDKISLPGRVIRYKNVTIHEHEFKSVLKEVSKHNSEILSRYYGSLNA
jgi:hypothetical protein